MIMPCIQCLPVTSCTLSESICALLSGYKYIRVMSAIVLLVSICWRERERETETGSDETRSANVLWNLSVVVGQLCCAELSLLLVYMPLEPSFNSSLHQNVCKVQDCSLWNMLIYIALLTQNVHFLFWEPDQYALSNSMFMFFKLPIIFPRLLHFSSKHSYFKAIPTVMNGTYGTSM